MSSCSVPRLGAGPSTETPLQNTTWCVAAELRDQAASTTTTIDDTEYFAAYIRVAPNPCARTRSSIKVNGPRKAKKMALNWLEAKRLSGPAWWQREYERQRRDRILLSHTQHAVASGGEHAPLLLPRWHASAGPRVRRGSCESRYAGGISQRPPPYAATTTHLVCRANRKQSAMGSDQAGSVEVVVAIRDERGGFAVERQRLDVE